MSSRKVVWTVRIINPIPSHPGMERVKNLPFMHGAWVESLRYAGFLRVIKPYDGKDGYEVLEIHAPHGQDSQVWSRHNAERMSTLGIDAAAAPEWLNSDGIWVRK